ncbi:MAG: glycerol-3-phosphate dehydrogenase/oxidase [Ilumatobacteraceae bacterium]|nr:glycerol-3-phosphate dehydrogenase/oxidase [Ilumatobacter sp.]MCB0984765.1 glycerol-3-phosphate dehydrogenase/oxidase [Ilumatobacter sp.]
MGGADFDRAAMLARLEREEFDVLVVGGGVTGAGVALDAAARGLRTALVERDDFAAGTSSKSSKLVHGGLRYLKDDPRLVREALRERERLRRNAPHLVGVMPFMIPVLTKDGVVSRTVARALGSAMWMYDIGGGWRIGKLHRRLRKKATLAHFPTMPSARVAAGYLYYDAAADDARLVLTLARTAAAHGAAVANRCDVVGLQHEDGEVRSATVRADGREFAVRARVVVNATGVWADGLREMDEGTDPDMIRPAKGVHLTVPWAKVRNDIAVVVPVPKDKRSLFLVPWGPLPDGTFRHAYIGTTDTDYDGPLEDPQCTAEDVEYILRAVNASITEPITAADVTGVWAGLRPLVKGGGSGRTADLSRRHLVQTSDHGVVTVTGGKLTTYREMAADAVDAALGLLGRAAKCTTARLRLLGAEGYKPAPAGTPQGHLGGRYGTLATEVQALVAADPSLGEPLVPGLPYLRAEAVYAVRHEMALTLDDVLSRRTRARLQDRAATVAAAPAVAALIAPELGWDDTELAAQVTGFVVACIAEEVRP